MVLPITRASLILCLILVQSVSPQSTRTSEELLKHLAIFGTTILSSVAGAPEPRSLEFLTKFGAQLNDVCEMDTGATGICKSSDDCTEPSELGNCIGFSETCCPNMVQPEKVTFPDKVFSSISVTLYNSCGRRLSNGLAEKESKDRLQFARFGEFPWMVGILTHQASDEGVWNEKTYQGGGTLIGPLAVLTAAHVVEDSILAGFPLKVRAGECDVEMDDYYPYIESPVQTVIIHEKFNNDNKRNDIALLILKDPIVANKYINYACLPTLNQEVPIVKNCLATGWGKDVYGPYGTLQLRLKRIELPTVPHDECQERLQYTALGPFFKLHPSFLCAGGIKGKADTCEGDGGSPLICPIPNVKKRYIQHGIVAWGVQCGDEHPGGYVDVGYFRNWIDNKMKAAGLDTSTYNYS